MSVSVSLSVCVCVCLQARRQEMKWVEGCFCKKWKMGGVFFVKKVENGDFLVKKWTFPQHKVHYVQYQYFYFTFDLFGGGVRTHPTHPLVYGPGVRLCTSISPVPLLQTSPSFLCMLAIAAT